MNLFEESMDMATNSHPTSKKLAFLPSWPKKTALSKDSPEPVKPPLFLFPHFKCWKTRPTSNVLSWLQLGNWPTKFTTSPSVSTNSYPSKSSHSLEARTPEKTEKLCKMERPTSPLELLEDWNKWLKGNGFQQTMSNSSSWTKPMKWSMDSKKQWGKFLLNSQSTLKFAWFLLPCQGRSCKSLSSLWSSRSGSCWRRRKYKWKESSSSSWHWKTTAKSLVLWFIFTRIWKSASASCS